MASVSVIIITKNEEKNIRRCLEAVKWADEIIVFDSGSTDNTVRICKEYTDKIWQTDWPGYGEQKQRALEKATCEWVLSVDADEVVSEQLQKLIPASIKDSKYSGFELPIRQNFYGQNIRFANGSAKCLRLFRRDCARFSGAKVHEGVSVSGRVSSLSQPIIHYSVATVGEMVGKMNMYTDIHAEAKVGSQKRGGVWLGVVKALWMFFRVYFLNLGFLDGRAGLVLAVGFAEGAFYRYVKLYYLRKDSAQ